MSNQRWSSYWPLPSPRRPRCPSSCQTSPSSSSAFPSPNPSFPGNSDSENGEISGKVAESPSFRIDAPTRGFAWWRRRKQKEHPNIPGQLKSFSLRELKVVTNNFSTKNFVGEGRFGNVYKGRLRDGSLVAIKIIQNWLIAGKDLQFEGEVELISMVVHPNILHIRGFCTTPTEQMLVYPFMTNGSVASRLAGLPPLKPPLVWATRRRIALGTARGLSYLHEHCDPKIVHRNVKAANIYLDKEDEAVVGGFGFAKLMDYNDTHVTTAVYGTFGHIAPEYLITGKCTEKTDVFSYGIMLMELITGKRIHELARLANDDDVMLLYWLKDILEEKRHGMLVDPSILDDYIEEEVVSLFQISQLCILGSAKDRPKMSEVVRMFEGDGLAERWEEWQRVEVSRHESDMAPHRIEDLTVDSDDDLDGHVLSSSPRWLCSSTEVNRKENVDASYLASNENGKSTMHMKLIDNVQ